MLIKKKYLRHQSVKMNNILRYLRKGELALFIIFLIVFIVFSFSSEYFFTLRNIMNVSGQMSIILIAAIGFSVLLIAGEVDISIGSLLAFVSIPLIEIMNITGSVPLGIILCLIFGINWSYQWIFISLSWS